MDKLFYDLVDVKKEAEKIMHDAELYYAKRLAQIDTEKKLLEKTLSDWKASHIKEIESSEIKFVNSSIEKIEDDYNRIKTNMDKKYAENHVLWENEVFSRCIKAGDDEV